MRGEGGACMESNLEESTCMGGILRLMVHMRGVKDQGGLVGRWKTKPN